MDWVTLLEQDAVVAAKQMLGWRFISRIDGSPTGGIIVETEAYRGRDDPAAHSYRGITPRTRPMFMRAGTVYVYFTYGMHHMINFTTGAEGEAEAVLIRALEPTEGIECMARRRGMDNLRQLTSGPGKLTRALGITLAQTGTTLGGELDLLPPLAAPSETDIVTTTRIGISEGRDLPWRFYLRENQFVSKR